MSNGAHVYTSEDDAALFAQFSKSMELVRERQRDKHFVSKQLQPIIDPNILAAQTPEGWHHITSNFSSAAEAIDATKCPLRWGFAEKPAEIPMICQPVDCRVKPVQLDQRMTSTEVYAKYTKMADPNKLFTFGARVQDFQRKQLVFTLWKFNERLWCACLLVVGGQRDVNVFPDGPDGVWGADGCVLVCESLYSPPYGGVCFYAIIYSCKLLLII